MNPQDPWGNPTPPPQTPPTPSGGNLPNVDPRLYASQQPQPQQALQQPTQPQPYSQPTAQQPTQPQVDYQYTTDPQNAVPAYQDPDRANDYTVDYLNSIAAPAQQKIVSKFAIFGMIGGVLIAAIIGVILFSAPKGKTTSDLIPALASRIDTLSKVTKAQQKHLSENRLAETNAALNSSLGTMDTDIKKIIEDQKIKKSQSKTTITAEEAYATMLTKTFDDAYQRGTLDRTYLSQMTYELTILEKQINSVKKTSKNKDIKAFCDNALANVELVLKSYTASSSVEGTEATTP